MKKRISKIMRSCVAAVLSVAMIAGSISIPAKAADVDDTINYVSLGDSMTNGYGFTGYEQGGENYELDSENEYPGAYGDAAYPNLFADALEEKTGKTVNHDKLAVSAMRAEDLNYLLGGREMPNDGWFSQVENYSGLDAEELKDLYQRKIAEADVITLAVGNASFGAYLMQYITSLMGVMGGSLSEDEKVDFVKALEALDPEQRVVVEEAYNQMMEKVAEYDKLGLLNATIPGKETSLKSVFDIAAYVGAGFVLNYEGVLEQIMELNPDVDIVLVGLMNTTYGMEITGEGFDPIPVGDILDEMFSALNAYIAALPTAMQAAGNWTEADFYYTEQTNPDFIVQAFDDLANHEPDAWPADLDGLSGKIVRSRTIESYNEALRPMIGPALGMELPAIKLEDVASYEFDVDGGYNIQGVFFQQLAQFNGTNAEELPLVKRYIEQTGDNTFSQIASNLAGVLAPEVNKEISIAIYLAIEEALVKNVDTLEISLDGLTALTGDIFGALGEMPEALKPANNPGPNTIKTELVNWFTGSATGNAMCKIFAMFKVGNGMSVHPTPKAHKEIADSLIAVYGNYTAKDETVKNLKVVAGILTDLVEEYYDDAYAYAYNYAKEAGYIDAAVAELEAIRAELNTVAANANFPASAEFAQTLAKAVADANATITALEQLLLNANELDEAALNKAIALLETLEQNLVDVKELATIAGTDLSVAAWQQMVVASQAALAKYEALKPVAIQQLKEAVAVGTEWLLEKANEAYAEFVETVCGLAKEYSPVLDAYLYDWFYNNPETVIGFFNEYGDEMGQFIAENYEAIFGVLGLLVMEFGDDVVNYVMENPEEVLTTMVEWYNAHGAETLELIKVYLDELGVTEAVTNPEGIKAALATINNWLADNMDAIADGIYDLADMMGLIDVLENALVELQAEVEATVNEYVAGAKAQIEAAIAALEAQVEVLEGQLKALEAELEAKRAELENAAEEIKAEIEAAIAQIEKAIETVNAAIEEVNAAIAKLQEQLAEIDAMVKELVDAVVDLNAAVEELIAMIKGESEVAITEVIAEVKAALDKIADAVEFAKGYVEDVKEAVDNAVAFVGDVIAKVEALQQLVDATNEYLKVEFAETIEQLKEAKAVAEAFAAEAYADLLEKIDAVVAAYNEALVGATTADYTVTEDSYYVSIGGSYANGTGLDEDLDETTFGYRVAEALGLDVDSQYAELARDGLRVEDLLYILDENFVADAYGQATIKNPAKLRDKYVEEIAKADLITLAAGNDNLTSFVSAQVAALLSGQQPYAMDWARYVGAENVAYVQKALEKVNAEFVELGLGEYAPMLTKVVESYAYGYVGFTCNYAEAINAIHTINEDALVIVVGMYNGIDNLVLNVEGTEVAVGDYVNYFVELTDAQYTSYAMLTPNTIFVEIPDTTTFMDETNAEGLSTLAYIMALYLDNSMLPSSTGHEYIKDQILGALNVTVEEKPFLKGDVNDDGVVDVIDSMVFDRYLAGWDVEINLKAAEINDDGEVDVIDVMLIDRYLAGWTETL